MTKPITKIELWLIISLLSGFKRIVLLRNEPVLLRNEPILLGNEPVLLRKEP
jgi:hypothetical protein